TIRSPRGWRMDGVSPNMPAKAARRWGRRRVVRKPMWKKAVVTLAEGDEIPEFKGG
ncbi:MAG TPA: 50S ribosomal protein L23, partial [Anaerolineae bacterium]|nr:50S ribosomal protein L23 [Anaerolineae bacterium]